MIPAPEALTRLEIVVALIAILGAAWTVANGWLKAAIVAPRTIQRMEGQHEQIEEEVGDVKDAVVGLAYSVEYDDVATVPEAIEEDLLDDDEGPGRYVETDPRFLRGGDDAPGPDGDD